MLEPDRQPARRLPAVTDFDLRWAAVAAFIWSRPKVGSRTVSKLMADWGDDDPFERIGTVPDVGLFWRPEVDALVERIAAVPFAWTLVRRGDPAYPAALAGIEHAPAGLFLRGDVDLLGQPSIAVVGTRKASDEGTRRAQRLARLLVQRGVAVTSGLAAGIDTAALSAARALDGKTIAVIGTPLDKVYPAENRGLQDGIAATGLVVSQYPFGVKVDRGNFPERNRTMAAIARATCVVEAGETSGTRHQVELSLKIGHPVLFMRSMMDAAAPWVRDYIAGKGGLMRAGVLDDPAQLDALF